MNVTEYIISRKLTTSGDFGGRYPDRSPLRARTPSYRSVPVSQEVESEMEDTTTEVGVRGTLRGGVGDCQGLRRGTSVYGRHQDLKRRNMTTEGTFSLFRKKK